MFAVAVKRLSRYRKSTPNCLSLRQITLQVRGSRPDMPSKNAEGIPKVAGTSRHAPASDKSRTEHGRCASLPRMIVPDLSIRLRRAFRRLAIGFRSSTGAIPSAALPLHRITVIWEGAPMREHRSSPRDGPVGWAATVPVSRIPVNRKRHLKRLGRSRTRIGRTDFKVCRALQPSSRAPGNG